MSYIHVRAVYSETWAEIEVEVEIGDLQSGPENSEHLLRASTGTLKVLIHVMALVFWLLGLTKRRVSS